jgi:hypothetical protein
VSPALSSLLSSSPIVVALKLHCALASTTHPPPFPITPGSLTGDPHRRGRPPPRRGPAIPGTLRPNWPYHRDPLPSPVPCHPSIITEPGNRRRTAADLTGGRVPTDSPPRHPLLAPSASPSLWHVGPRLRRRSPAGGPSGPPAHAAGPNFPSAQLAEEISFLFLFPFSFPIYIYMYIY